MIDINEMSRKQFESLPYFNYNDNNMDVDSIVLIPTRQHDSSGYNIYEVVACNGRKAFGKCYGYDTFSIYISAMVERVGIDCLRGSGLMRIFLPDGYKIDPSYHRIDSEKKRNKMIELGKNKK